MTLLVLSLLVFLTIGVPIAYSLGLSTILYFLIFMKKNPISIEAIFQIEILLWVMTIIIQVILIIFLFLKKGHEKYI